MGSPVTAFKYATFRKQAEKCYPQKTTRKAALKIEKGQVMSDKMNTTTTNQPVRKNAPPANRREEYLNDNVQDGIPGGKYPIRMALMQQRYPNAKASTYPKPAQLPTRYCYYFHKDNQILRWGCVDSLVRSNTSRQNHETSRRN